MHVDLTLEEIIAEMDELGRAKFHVAQLVATNKKFVARIVELEKAAAEDRAAEENPAGEPS